MNSNRYQGQNQAIEVGTLILSGFSMGYVA